MIGNRPRFAQEVIPFAPPVNFNSSKYVFESLLLEPGNAEQLVAAAEVLEFLVGLNRKAIVNRFCRLRPDTRNANEFDQPGRNVALEVLEEIHLAGIDVFNDFPGQILSDSCNVLHRTLPYKDFNVVGEVLQTGRCAAIRANSKRIGDLDFQQVGDLIEDGSDLEVSH